MASRFSEELLSMPYLMAVSKALRGENGTP